MEWQQVVVDIFEWIPQSLEKALRGLTQADLDHRPSADTNSIGWLTWHLTRGQDRAFADFAGEKQLWIKNGWHARFGRPGDPADTGFGHRLADVAAFKSPDVTTLLEYNRAVVDRSKKYLSSMTSEDLSRPFNHPRFPTVAARLMAAINDSFQHTGQVGYLRGLMKGKGWMDV
jgi:uncharacterized damage-inducible protein DinB